MLAAFLILWLGLLLTVVLTIRRNSLKVILSFILIAGQFILALTYSRGGFAAWGVCLILIYVLCRRKIIGGMLIAFILSILVIPDGCLRLESIADTGDGSILHRLWLWRGGAGIMADFPWCGYPHSAGKYYELQYMPWFISENYRNFLSDTLTIGVKYGAVAFAGCWLVIFTFISSLYSNWKQDKAVAAAALSGVWAAVAASGIFSTFYFVRAIFYSYLILLSVSSAYLFYRLKAGFWRPEKKIYVIPAAASLLLTAAVLVTGQWVNNNLKYHVSSVMDNENRCFFSNSGKEKILYFFAGPVLLAENDFFPDVRKWADNNTDILLYKIDSGEDGLNKVKDKLNEATRKAASPVTVIGIGAAAANVLTATAQSAGQCNIRHLLLYNCVAQWPFEHLSAINFIDMLKIPVYLLYDNPNSQNDAKLLSEKTKTKQKIQLVRCPEVNEYHIQESVFKLALQEDEFNETH